jgi:hypothetical protein
MSAPLFVLAPTNTSQAEAPTSVAKGLPSDPRGASPDFASLLSAGVRAAASEERPAPEGTAPSLEHAVAVATGAPLPLQGRGQRRNEERAGGSSQVAVALAPVTVSPPVVLSPPWIHDAQPHGGAGESFSSRPDLPPGTRAEGDRQGSTGSARASAAAAAVETSSAGGPAQAAAGATPVAQPDALGLTTMDAPALATGTGAPVIAAAIPKAVSTVTGTAPPGPTAPTTPTALAPSVPTALMPALPPARVAPPATTTPTATAPITQPTTGRTTQTTAAPMTQTTAAPTTATAPTTPTATMPATVGRVPAPWSAPAVSPVPSLAFAAAPAAEALASAVVPAPPAPTPKSQTAQGDVLVADQAVTDVAPPATTGALDRWVAAVPTPSFQAVVSAEGHATAPAAVADAPSPRRAIGADASATDPVVGTVAPASPRRGTIVLDPVVRTVVSASENRAAFMAILSKETTGRAPTFDTQPQAPVATHSPAATGPERVDHASASAESASTASAAPQSKVDGVASASPENGQQPNAQPQAQLQPATLDVGGGANAVTVVSKASPAAALSPSAGAKLRDALASVANHAVLRGEASGQIDVPELGRVAVRAHSVGGAVDVEVTAEGSDARATLHGHIGAMTADLRAADVPVGRFTIDRTDASSGSTLGSSTSSRDRDPNAGGHSARDNRPQADADDAPAGVGAAAPGRVRIVL